MCLDLNEPILVHCNLGINKSASIICAALVKRQTTHTLDLTLSPTAKRTPFSFREEERHKNKYEIKQNGFSFK